MRVLLIEDDQRLAGIIKQVMLEEGFDVDTAFDGAAGVELAMRGTYDVAIVDWMLPERDGPAVIRAIRSARLPTACMLLTARTQIEDRVAGLDSGADDYLPKPFSFDELLARVRALGRRFTIADGSDSWELRQGELVMDLKAHTARRGDVVLDLTNTEWRLLEYLMRNPGQTLTREQILDYVWSYDAEVLGTSVDVYISYLRKKLVQGGMRDPITTVRGIGYRMESSDA